MQPLNNFYHISEQGNIQMFIPRPSPSLFEGLDRDVVFAISEKLLHNYLFPRDCPRVCYYATPETSKLDKERFFGRSTADFILAIEKEWVQRIKETTLYCYEFPTATFELLDDCAGYYVSYQTVAPSSVSVINNPFEVLSKQKNLELRVLSTLWKLADEVSKSTLNFSLIRMRNAKTRNGI